MSLKNINKHKIINDPVHGFITIPTELIYDLIEHKYFQRLRRISQTGLTHYVYPGAVHTRFHHALGAMHLMQLSLQTLRNKGIEISEKEYEAACIAILLHDVGHGPFSHALESTLMDEIHHETLSIAIIEELNAEFNGSLDLALEMFLGKYSRKFFYQLISSQVDVDRLDYLKRDSFFTGVSEGNINSERIITMMNVYEDELVFDAKGIYSIEKYLVSRMFMYWQVYYHKTSLTAETILIHVLKRAKELCLNGVEVPAPENLQYFLEKQEFKTLTQEALQKFTSLDDTDLLSTIKNWIRHSDKTLSMLCDSVLNRKLPKSKFLAEELSSSEIDKLEEKIQNHFKIEKGSYFLQQQKIDLKPYTFQNPIKLLTKSQQVILLHEHSEQTLTQQLAHPNYKYHLFFPREITL